MEFSWPAVDHSQPLPQTWYHSNAEQRVINLRVACDHHAEHAYVPWNRSRETTYKEAMMATERQFHIRKPCRCGQDRMLSV